MYLLGQCQPGQYEPVGINQRSQFHRVSARWPARPAVVSRVLLDLITVLAQYIWHPLNWAPVRLSLLAKSFDSEFQGEGTGGLPAVHDHDAGRPGSRRKGRTAP
jgi:hypothetical protein